jgi:hypothetical protein
MTSSAMGSDLAGAAAGAVAGASTSCRMQEQLEVVLDDCYYKLIVKM